MRYWFIRQHRRQFRLAAMRRVLRVSKSGYYAWLRRPESPRRAANRVLLCHIKAAHERSRRTYGRRRIHSDLGQAGIACSLHRVARLMRQNGLCGLRRRRFRAPAAFELQSPAGTT